MKRPLFLALVLATVASTVALVPTFGQSAQPVRVKVNGVELHYTEKGQGEPLVLLHGGTGDYRSWNPQTEAPLA